MPILYIFMVKSKQRKVKVLHMLQTSASIEFKLPDVTLN